MMQYVGRYLRVCYQCGRKLNQYAKQHGISYRTALRWFRAGTITGYQAPTGMITVTAGEPHASPSAMVTIYARVSSLHRREQRQAAQLWDYGSMRGYQMAQVVKEVACHVHDRRPKALALLTDTSVTRMVVAHRGRFTRFGFA